MSTPGGPLSFERQLSIFAQAWTGILGGALLLLAFLGFRSARGGPEVPGKFSEMDSDYGEKSVRRTDACEEVDIKASVKSEPDGEWPSEDGHHDFVSIKG